MITIRITLKDNPRERGIVQNLYNMFVGSRLIVRRYLEEPEEILNDCDIIMIETKEKAP